MWLYIYSQTVILTNQFGVQLFKQLKQNSSNDNCLSSE